MQDSDAYSWCQEQTATNVEPKIPTVPKFVYGLLNSSHKLCPDSMLFLLTENITVLTNV